MRYAITFNKRPIVSREEKPTIAQYVTLDSRCADRSEGTTGSGPCLGQHADASCPSLIARLQETSTKAEIEIGAEKAPKCTLNGQLDSCVLVVKAKASQAP